jgi:hypothetical protein
MILHRFYIDFTGILAARNQESPSGAVLGLSPGGRWWLRQAFRSCERPAFDAEDWTF